MLIYKFVNFLSPKIYLNQCFRISCNTLKILIINQDYFSLNFIKWNSFILKIYELVTFFFNLRFYEVDLYLKNFRMLCCLLVPETHCINSKE
jgi:hypothetical protein